MHEDIRRFLIDKSNDLENLTSRFSSYSSGISRTNLDQFVSQFEPEHCELALKLLEHVDFYDGPRTIALARDLGQRIRSLTNADLDDVNISPIKPVIGTSSESIQRKLRQTMATTARERTAISKKFIKFMDLSELANIDTSMSIFFVDDFIGSGDTVIEAWGRVQMWENENHSYFVGALVGYTDAINRVEEETANHFEIICSSELSEETRAFHPSNRTFTEEEKIILQNYCKKIPNSEQHVYGHRNGQSLVIFSDASPNNSLPILHRSTDTWKALFPRYY
ncbi:MAG: phosphoribosyltransferase-like protein [Candidatus Nitrosopumilus sp. bin_68KS]